jgi:hypothetical protein
MAEKEEKLQVKIKTKLENPKKCSVTPDFVAKQGSTIVFEFDEFKETAEIKFLGPSPLETAPPVRPGAHKVKKNAPEGPVRYVVTWPDAGGGDGNGTGEVITG